MSDLVKRAVNLRTALVMGAIAVVIIAAFVGGSVRAEGTPNDPKAPGSSQGEHFWTYPDSPPGTIYFPRDGFRLEPADPTASAGAKIATSDQALAFLKANAPFPTNKDTTEEGPAVAFGYFTNDVSGVPQPDGTLKLTDEHELAWLFTWTLSGDFLTPTHPRGGNPHISHGPGECIYFGFVTTTAMIPVAGQECSRTSEPAFLVK